MRYTNDDRKQLSKIKYVNDLKNYHITDIELYLNNIKYLNQFYSYLSFYPFSFILDVSDKKYTHMVLSSGDLVEIADNQKFSIISANEDDFLINIYTDMISTYKDIENFKNNLDLHHEQRLLKKSIIIQI